MGDKRPHHSRRAQKFSQKAHWLLSPSHRVLKHDLLVLAVLLIGFAGDRTLHQ